MLNKISQTAKQPDTKNGESTSKKDYHAPVFTEHGTVAEITRGGAGPAGEPFGSA